MIRPPGSWWRACSRRFGEVAPGTRHRRDQGQIAAGWRHLAMKKTPSRRTGKSAAQAGKSARSAGHGAPIAAFPGAAARAGASASPGPQSRRDDGAGREAKRNAHPPLGPRNVVGPDTPMMPAFIPAPVKSRGPAVKARTGSRDRETLAHLPTRLDGFYPKARALKRQLKLVIGPTNSGKTYRAMERLRAADSGVYLGPLRLLALEVRDRLLELGLLTSLVTGELIEEIEDARFISATVEMIDFDHEVEVVVIDEVQMVGDEERGSAWLQAILGAPAREVWLLGAPEARKAILALAEWMDEPVEIIELERLSPFEVLKAPTRLGDIPPGSAVVAFSRSQVIDIAGELRERYRKSPALVYGALSPEVRREQARQFREGEADVLVCTDAVGLGLNLPIKAMFFSTGTKYNGKEEVPVPRDLVWQIAGRAGRYGMEEHGLVGALGTETLSYIRRVLARRPEQVPVHFRYEANWIIVEALARFLETDRLAEILFYFWRELALERSREFEPVVPPSQVGLAWRVDRHVLDLRVKLMLSRAPVPMVRDEAVPEFEQFVAAVARKEPVLLSSYPMLQARLQLDNHESAEQSVKLLTLYCWLHYRLPTLFPQFEEAQVEQGKLNSAILAFIGRNRGKKCRECGRALPWETRFRLCDTCFRAS
jgi:ATP-dependent RNA helicase SUPV3L1/SUV3